MLSDLELTENEISSTETETDDGSDSLDQANASDADEDFIVVREDGSEIDFNKEGSDMLVTEENPDDIPPATSDKAKGPMWDKSETVPA